MEKKDRDSIDDLFRKRLFDFEADVEPDDWEAISRRLPKEAREVSFLQTFRYWIAAAAILLLAISVGIYLSNETPPPMAQEKEPQIVPEIRELDTQQSVAVVPEKPVMDEAHTVTLESRLLAVAQPVELLEKEWDYAMLPVSVPQIFGKEYGIRHDVPGMVVANPVSTSAEKVERVKDKPSRKWGFGMGAGGFSVGSNNVIQGSVLKNTLVDVSQLDLYNAASNSIFSSNTPKTNIRHKMPVSFSMGVSRFITDRWSLQTGLSYSFLVSEWSMSGTYRGETKQKLHFLGIPLSVVYKIGEWQRFMFYATAGGMAEMNLTGTSVTTLYSGTENMGKVKERVRMNDWYWSINARGGVAYPIFTFLSAFAEVGASYYFDNGSAIETVHSDKPCNASFNMGLRLGF